MLQVVILGSAAGGGVPQWNCGCVSCMAARRQTDLQRSQTSVAVSADGRHWFLINASPDLRQQINATPQLQPRAGRLRDSPILGVILTNGEIDAVAGLLTLREGAPLAIYGHPQVLAILQSNSLFDVLDPARVTRHAVVLDQPFEPTSADGRRSGLQVTAFAVPGQTACYLRKRPDLADRDAAADDSGVTLGLRIAAGADGAALLFVAACARIDDALRHRLAGARLLLFDGTLWQDDELIAAGFGHTTGQAMGHVAMSGAHGSLAALADLDIGNRLFVHVNNSNPALRPASQEAQRVKDAGWHIASDGLEFVL